MDERAFKTNRTRGKDARRVLPERGCAGPPTSRSATDNPEDNGIFAAVAAGSSSLRFSEHSPLSYAVNDFHTVGLASVLRWSVAKIEPLFFKFSMCLFSS